MTLIDALAATHVVQLGLHGDHGSLCLEHRLVGAPDDDCLDDLVAAARATYARLHDGDAPEETNVSIEPLSADERDAEVLTAERRMAHALGLDDPDTDFYAD